MILINILLVLMILAALIAVEAREMISSVAAVAAVGLCLSLLFLVLHAPDLAIILLIVEVITLAALARIVQTGNEPRQPRLSSSVRITAVIFLAVFAIAGYHALQGLPAFGNPVPHPVFNIPGTHNAVAAAFCGFRVFDMLCSLMVLFASAIGAGIMLAAVKGKNT